MHRLPDGIAVRDVVQWLHGTWFRWNGRWMEFRDMTDTNTVIAADKEGMTHHVPVREVEVHWPHCGSVNVLHKFAVHAFRIPAKQFSRSYNPELIRVHVPLRWDLLRFYADDAVTADAVNTISGYAYNLLEAMTERDYPAIGNAIAMIRDKQRPSVAVSSSVILAARGNSIHVFYRGKTAGVLHNGKLQHNDLDPIVERKLRKLLEGV